MGLEAESQVRVCKAHRCALDTDYKFISQNISCVVV